MTATTNYQAGFEANQTVLSYALESQWGVMPSVAFQQIRFTGESLAGQKTRTRPNEVLSTGEVSAAITTQENAGGGVNFALSYATYDDLFAGALNNDWTPAVAVNGISGDVSISAGAAGTARTLTSTLAGKFTGINPGQWVRVGGFTQSGANGYFLVTAATGTTLTFLNAQATTAETPAGSAAQVRASNIVNGTTFKSFYLQKGFNATTFLQYPGSYVSGLTISGGSGQFLNGSFTFMSKQEISATVNASTGAVIAPPSGKVHDPVAGFSGVFVDGSPINAVVDSFSISATDTGAAMQYGMGAAAAQGQLCGLNEVKGQCKMYFRDFSIYQRYKSELTGNISFVSRDAAQNAYVISVLNGALMNPKIVAGGPNQPVYLDMSIEGNPRAGGGTIAIDRLSVQ